MKKGTKNLLMIGGVAILGYFLWKKSKKAKTTIVKEAETEIKEIAKDIKEDVADI